MEPLLTDAQPHMRVYREEVFGPVIRVQSSFQEYKQVQMTPFLMPAQS